MSVALESPSSVTPPAALTSSLLLPLSPPSVPHPRILIVDDARAIHDDFRKILVPRPDNHEVVDDFEIDVLGAVPKKTVRRTFEIDSAFQGQEALARVQQSLREGQPYAMAFVDVRMPPGWDGLETITRIWEVYPDLQVVICSAYSDYSWDEMIAAVGQTDRLVILKKPFDVVEVLQLANALVAKWQLQQQVRTHVTELEERIRERTRSLEEAKAALETEIVERNQMEVQLRHAQKMESIGQLAAGIAHEINTPTQFIGDNTRFVRDSFRELIPLFAAQTRLLAAAEAGSVPPALIEEIKTVRHRTELDYLIEEIPQALSQSLDGIDRVAKIVRAMKEFSHPGATEKTAIDLNHAIESTLIVCHGEWKYAAEVVKDFDLSLPPVPVLPGEFNQVVLNLIINATHAIIDQLGAGSSRKGTITVCTRRDGDWAEIRLRDTGTGIPESARLRVFDPFFTTKRVGQGTGQGLAIAHAVVVEKHGGTIHFDTQLGEGTTFIIRLPLQARSSPPSAS
jgi:signal transduction histidine kinase